MTEIIYGRQPVREVLCAGRRGIQAVLLRDGLRGTPDLDEILRLAASRQARLTYVPQRQLDDLAQGGHHQGIAIKVSGYPYASLDEVLSRVRKRNEPPLVLFLDHLQDPQNFGAILRTADAVGVHGVIIPKDRAVEVTPTVVRVAAGASEHLYIVRVTNLVQTMRRFQDEDGWELAGLEALPEAQVHTAARLDSVAGLVVGSEGKGLGRLVRENCNLIVRLPQFGGTTSLNAASAAAVALFEMRRQRTAAAVRRGA
jgi:23S rRNA (guanosine2251-2'-O)-methyltransferase